MKLEVKQFGKYSLHVTFPKKACKNLEVGDFVEVLIDGTVSQAPDPESDSSKLEERIQVLEELAKPVIEEKAKEIETKKRRELEQHNKLADDGYRPAPAFRPANKI